MTRLMKEKYFNDRKFNEEYTEDDIAKFFMEVSEDVEHEYTQAELEDLGYVECSDIHF